MIEKPLKKVLKAAFWLKVLGPNAEELSEELTGGRL